MHPQGITRVLVMTTLSQYLKQEDIRFNVNEVAEHLGMHRATLYRKFEDTEIFDRELKSKLGKLKYDNISANRSTKTHNR